VRLDEVSLDWAGKPGPYNLMAAEEMTFHFPVGVGFKPALRYEDCDMKFASL